MSALKLEPGLRAGCRLVDEKGNVVHSMSWMDAARTLFDLKDGLRRSSIGRRCVDQVAALRTGNRLARTPERVRRDER